MKPWSSQPAQRPSTDSIHISTMQIAQSVLGSVPVMPLLVMIVMDRARARPISQAKRFGLAETHSGGRRRVIQPAMMPTGL